ncbi:MAG: hypothetical protein ACLP00_12585, partial [Terracidiphilus sp.]
AKLLGPAIDNCFFVSVCEFRFEGQIPMATAKLTNESAIDARFLSGDYIATATASKQLNSWRIRSMRAKIADLTRAVRRRLASPKVLKSLPEVPDMQRVFEQGRCLYEGY